MYPIDGLDCKSLVGTMRPLEGGTKRSGPSSPTSIGTPPITSPPVAKCPPKNEPAPKSLPPNKDDAQLESLSIPSRPPAALPAAPLVDPAAPGRLSTHM